MNIARNFSLALGMTVALATASIADGVASPEGMVVLTVSGDLENPNRGPAGEDDKTVLAKLGITFEKGVEFDLAQLAALEQGAYDRTVYAEKVSGTFSGPKISAILDAVGKPDATVWAMALDGYQAEIPAKFIGEYDPILATHLDGRPLAVGGLGPTFVIFPTSDDEDVNAELDRMLPWATIHFDLE